MKHFQWIASLVVVCFAGHAVSAQVPDRPPNFIIILMDDLGYGDVRAFNTDSAVDTPHLSRMAEQGMKMTSFYSASSVCTPSRAALMTGSYPRRVGLEIGWKHAVLFPGDPIGLNPDEVTIADMLKKANYATGCFGKWHLGDQTEFMPLKQGFDEYFGIPYSNDMWPKLKRWDFPPLPLMRNTEVIGLVKDLDGQADLARQFTEEAIRFIRKHRNEPFFIYIPHAFPHSPRKASPKFMRLAKGDETLAQVMETDWSVGQVLNAVREAGISEQTMVVFTSDNGPAPGLSSGPLRGRKGSAFEGGFRVPTIAWWPGTIPAGTVCSELATTMDLLPSIAHFAGVDLQAERTIDGKNIAPLLLGEPGARTPHDRFFYDQRNQLEAVRAGQWKLFKSGELYNLKDDVGEKSNVAKAHPDVVKRLRGYMKQFEQDMRENARPVGRVKESKTITARPGKPEADARKPVLADD